jgi:hypothetical protein
MFIIFTILLIGAHFGCYLIWIRNLSWGRSEKGIFAYHALSFIALLSIGCASVIIVTDEDSLAAVIGGCSLHAIYSMTFLEFWSISEGSFSFAVLSRIRSATLATNHIVSEFTVLGAAKKTSRIESLVRLKLIRRDNTRAWRLTARGQGAAAIARVLLWVSATREHG